MYILRNTPFKGEVVYFQSSELGWTSDPNLAKRFKEYNDAKRFKIIHVGFMDKVEVLPVD